MKASDQGENFQVSSSLAFLCLTIKEFRNKALPSISCQSTKENGNSLHCLEGSWSLDLSYCYLAVKWRLDQGNS